MKIISSQDWVESRPWLDAETADVKGYVSAQSDEVDYDLERKLTEWRERGLVIFENVVNIDHIEALKNDIDYLRAHHKDYELSAEIRGVQKSIAEFTQEDLNSDGFKFNSIHSISKAAAHLSLTKTVTDFLHHVFMSPAVALQSLTFYKGSQQPAHVDYPYVRCQSRLAHLAASWIPLEDIHADSGPLTYYPGSHKLAVSGFFDWGKGSIVYETDSVRNPAEFSNYLERKIGESGIKPEIFLPKRGDVLIWHGNLIHKGSEISNHASTRKSYVTHYTSYDSYPVAHRRPDSKGLAEHGGYAYDYPWLNENRSMLPSAR
ncbi:MAG: phytanoyl-CoA dioxygenase family protein [Rhodanobacter lindaniclasticus]